MSKSEQKPFACSIVGCNMSFINEDHLTVHKKKHDMMLNLGINNKNNFFIDQTPTPTRFIRNCDEVGLFQDLPNDNPFEETFRQAVESGKNDIQAVPMDRNNDDSLHTPKVFPHIVEESLPVVSSISPGRQVQQSSETLVVKDDEDRDVKYDVKEAEVDNHDNAVTDDKEKAEILLMTDPSENNKPHMNLATKTPPINTDVQILLKTHDGKIVKLVASADEKTQSKPTLAKGGKQSMPDVPILESNFLKPHSTATPNQKSLTAKVKLKEALKRAGNVSQSHSKKVQRTGMETTQIAKAKVNADADFRKRDILERNRASSMRARAKRKAWIEQLQQSLRTANEMNASLQGQLKNLHAQVARLKTLLLAHKDCPITQAMEKGNGVVVGSRILTINPDESKHVLPDQTRAKPLKRPGNELPIAPKKRPLLLASVGNPLILPNTSPTVNTITLRSAELLKPPPVISIMTPVVNPQNSTTFLSLSSANIGKVCAIPRAVVVNGNTNEHAASKTNGT
ncbi:hypothetical protein QAD02_020266 [Eretmocerus hayati]|uniref:Uncharacterized protein n=1 Tax=Eretmocerus hayati TaxID=131215 RepID=A0ACC2PLK4_9HYME|nr:hypothetical protein QAD02_020266 [Eretmocerus hayati]